MLSKSSKYAIRAVLYIAKAASKEEKIGSKQVAIKLEIPAPFLAKTLQELTRKKIISSIKGPHGGFYLTEENKQKSLFDIIDCVDDIHKFEECFLGQLECDDQKPCVVHHLYKPFKNKLIEKLKTKSIIELADENAINNSLSKIIC
jgi:Rrf2 family protein